MSVKSKLERLNELVRDSSREEIIWMSGYLDGIVRGYKTEEAPVAAKSSVKATVVYGTETGNSKKVATEAASRLKKEGIGVKLMAVEQYRNLADLSKEEKLLVVLSTHGDGEPPAAARKFYDFVHATDTDLKKVQHAVLALGDTAYPLFCKAGEDVDVQLERLGSKRLVPLQKCDTDYEKETKAWLDNVIASLKNGASTAAAAPKEAAAKSSGKKWWDATVAVNLNLNDRGSLKQTHHIELVTDTEVDYRPGDSIGVVAQNSEEKVQAIIGLLPLQGGDIAWRGETYSLYEILKRKANIVYLPHRLIHKYSGIVEQEIPETRMDLLDLLRIYPVKDAAQAAAVVEMLEPIAPRLYSISSSPATHGSEVHITVAKNNFQIEEDKRWGLCSGYLNGLAEGSTVQFYVHRNSEFHLPPDDKDLIMIGPGTGIAPFRSFLFERDATGATGRSWLFFGDQHFVTDFLYQSELQQLQETGVLTRINTAFSRDQQEKIYVQHKLLKHAAEVFNWLQSGAYIYLCGAKDPMSADVEATLLKIIQEQGDNTPEEAEEYLLQLKEDGRYRKDVY
jgi:sulfite reductase (NADPH) flavoprotein alpha-component